MIKRLRRQFVCVIMVIVMLLMATVLGVAIYFTARNLEDQSVRTMRLFLSDHQMQDTDLRPDAPAVRPDLPGDARRPEKPAQGAADIRLPCFAVCIGPQGELLDVSGRYFDPVNREAYIQILAEAALETDADTGVLSEHGLRFLKEGTPERLTIVFSDITAERSALRSLYLNCTLLFIAAWILFFIIAISLSHWVIHPVAQAWELQKQFVADASHELKTPLSVILANAELLQSEDSPEERKQFAQSILTTSYQMRTLVESLLEMARVDSGAVRLQFEELDFSQLVSDAVLSFQLLYEEKQIGLTSRIQEGLRLSGSEQHLFQVLDVLLDNALKYTHPQTTVTVRLIRTGGSCLLSVTNQSEPLSREDLQNIFKRFYRIDRARCRNGSYGLGLPIAETIVAAHKGKIWAQSEASGNTFFVQLPLT